MSTNTLDTLDSLGQLSDEQLANMAAPPETAAVDAQDGEGVGSSNDDDAVVDPILPPVRDEESEEGEQEEPEGQGEQESQPVDYEAFYRQVVGQPLAANGKKIEIRSPEEAIQLMQMGANYTRKMQDLAPFRKALAILQKGDLLDEAKLDFLVALNKKDPEAVKKYLKDNQIDPLDIDLSQDSAYRPGQHMVQDSVMAFEEAVAQVTATQEGALFMQELDKTWDTPSKNEVFDSPDALPVLLAQKQSGVYDLIAGEVERMRVLGQLPQQTPFLAAYKAVGEAMQKQGAFNSLRAQTSNMATSATANPAVQPTNPLAQRIVVKPQSNFKPNAKAAAASPTRGKGGATTLDMSALAAMNDDKVKELAARMLGRL